MKNTRINFHNMALSWVKMENTNKLRFSHDPKWQHPSGQMECVRLRVQDIDFERSLVYVRAAKGDKDRTTVLPKAVQSDLRMHIERVKRLHEEGIFAGFGEVFLPSALSRKYPHTAKEFRWQTDEPCRCQDHRNLHACHGEGHLSRFKPSRPVGAGRATLKTGCFRNMLETLESKNCQLLLRLAEGKNQVNAAKHIEAESLSHKNKLCCR
jgi:hypothetical protein